MKQTPVIALRRLPVMLRMLGLLLLVGFAASPGPDLNDASFTKVRDLIRPSREETSWLQVPWQLAFWNAVLEAQRLDKPILIWAPAFFRDYTRR